MHATPPAYRTRIAPTTAPASTDRARSFTATSAHASAKPMAMAAPF